MDYGSKVLLEILSEIQNMTVSDYNKLYDKKRHKESFNIILDLDMLNELLNDLNEIDEFNKENFQRLHYMKIEAISKKGTDEGAVLIDGQWIPKSQLRCDFDGNLWVSLWFYDKITKDKR